MTTLQQLSAAQVSKEITCNENFETLSAGGLFGKKHSTTSGLTWGYYGGLYNGNTIADGTVSLTNAADNYVVVLRSSGVVSVSTSSTNSTDPLYAKLYKLTTAGSVVTATLDQRWDANGLLFNTSGASGTVTSVAATVPSFLSVSGSPITTSGTLALSYSGTALPVANGGSGATSLTAYAPVFGGTTSTGAVQSGTVGTAGQVLTSNGAGALPTFQAAAAGGDFSSNTATSVDSEIVLFSGTAGKTGKRATGTGYAKVTSGVLSADSAATVRTDLQGDGLTAGSAGFREIPQNSQSAAYTLVASDSGKHLLHPSADTTARTFTIPANSSVAYPVGTAITFVNQNAAGVLTIAITTDTMRLAGPGTTGSRTLAANGVCTAIKLTSTEWIVSGTGLT